MSQKNMQISFLIGAALQASFTGAFKAAAQAFVGVKAESKKYNTELKALNAAFSSGVIRAESYKKALMFAGLQNMIGRYARLKANIIGLNMGMNGLRNTADPFIKATKIAANFEQAMSKVGAITKANAADMEKLSAKAKELGATTQYTATQSAEAMSYLGMAGWNTNQILAGMPGLLNLAAAGGTNLAKTADIVSDNLTAFGLSAEKAGHMADVYATIITSTNTNVEMLGDTMKYAAPVANAFGASLEETAALAGLMANSGIKASQAGTALRSGFLRLAGPPKMAQKAMDSLGMTLNDITAEQKEAALAMASLGIQMSDTAGPKKMATILTELRNKTKDLGQEEKLAAMKAIFGTEAATGWIAVLDSGDATFEKLVASLEKSDGAAGKMAERMQNNAAGAMTRFNSAVEAINISVGEAFLPALAKGADALAVIAGRFANNKAMVNTALYVGAVSAALFGFVATVSAATAVVNAYKIASTGLNIVMGLMRASTIGATGATIANYAATTAAAVAQWAWNGAVAAAGIGAQIIRLTISTAAMIANSTATGAMTAAQWAWNAALSANPIGLVILAVAGLIAAGIALYNNWDTIKAFFVNLWDDPKAAFDGFIDGIKEKFSAAFDWLQSKWQDIKNFLSTPIFGRVNIAAEGAKNTDIQHNAAGGIYPKGKFLTYFAEESGESAIPHKRTAKNIQLLAQTNAIMGNPLNVGAAPKNFADPNATKNNIWNNYTNQPQNITNIAGAHPVYNQNTKNNTWNNYVQNAPHNENTVSKQTVFNYKTNNIANNFNQESEAPRLVQNLVSVKEAGEKPVNIEAPYSPVINIYNNGENVDKIRDILDEQQRKFFDMLNNMREQARRLNYA